MHAHAREIKLRLNHHKFHPDQVPVSYVGQMFTKEELSTDPAMTEAITNMPVTQDPLAIQHFFSMGNYFEKFIPNLSNIAAPVRLCWLS